MIISAGMIGIPEASLPPSVFMSVGASCSLLAFSPQGHFAHFHCLYAMRCEQHPLPDALNMRDEGSGEKEEEEEWGAKNSSVNTWAPLTREPSESHIYSVHVFRCRRWCCSSLQSELTLFINSKTLASYAALHLTREAIIFS